MSLVNRVVSVSLAFFLVFFVNPYSWAHAEFESSNPKPNSTLQVMPDLISASFGEDLMVLGEEAVNTIALLDSQDREIPLSKAQIVGKTISAQLPGADQLSAGEYRILYRVVSADGHPIEGEIAFTFAPQEPLPTESPSPVAVPVKESAPNFGFIGPLIAIILVVGAVLLIRKKK